MREAVIVSTARTGIGRAFRGALNNIKSPTLMGHAIQHAVQRAGINPGEVEDVVIGSAMAARCTACWIAWPISVGDLMLFNTPRNARPMPVRAVETMTASLMVQTPRGSVKRLA